MSVLASSKDPAPVGLTKGSATAFTCRLDGHSYKKSPADCSSSHMPAASRVASGSASVASRCTQSGQGSAMTYPRGALSPVRGQPSSPKSRSERDELEQ